MNARTEPSARRLPIRWSLVATSLLTLAAIVYLRKAEPDYEAKLAPLTLPGAIAQRVEARNFAIEVKRIRLARAYLVRGDYLHPQPRMLKPDGIWLSALTEAEALKEPGYIGAQLRTRDGLVYLASGSSRPKLPGSNFNGQELATGLRGTGGYFFDVPPDRLHGAHLQFYWGPLAPGPMDHLIDIDLGLDGPKTQRLLQEAKPVLDLR